MAPLLDIRYFGEGRIQEGVCPLRVRRALARTPRGEHWRVSPRCSLYAGPRYVYRAEEAGRWRALQEVSNGYGDHLQSKGSAWKEGYSIRVAGLDLGFPLQSGGSPLRR